MWIDSHCHLNDDAFQNDYLQVIERADNVGAIVVVGFDLPSSSRAVELSREFNKVWAAVGIHPHDAKTWDIGTRQSIEVLLKEPKVIALGEIGLDYHYNYSSREEQLKAFRDQIDLAKEYQKPIIIHNREAHQDTMTILTEQRLGSAGGVMHCFSGSSEMAEQCLKLGLYISFAGPVTFNNAHRLRDVVSEIPLDRILIETDAPYLTPHPFRGRRNEPEYVKWVGEKVADIKKVEPEELQSILEKNLKSLFRTIKV